MTKELCLTHEGLSRLGASPDFELKTDVLENTIKCSKSQISFISPIISNLLLNDPTINEFTLKTPNSSRCSDILRSLLNGSSVTITENLKYTFLSISIELGNEELLPDIHDDLTLDNVFENIQIKYLKSVNIKKEIEFIASHFNEFKTKDFMNLDISIINDILSSKSLVVASKHYLLNILIDLISEKGNDYRILLSNLKLEYLDVNDIDTFIRLIDEDDIGYFLPCIYRRLLCPIYNIDPIRGFKETHSQISIPFIGKKFDGIFAHMWKEINDNPVTRKVVDIKDSIKCRSFCSLVDPEMRKETNRFCSTENIRNSPFIINFKDKKVSLSGYSLKSPSGDRYFMKSWKIEGSNDKETWTAIDEQRKSDDLVYSFAEGYWPCKPSSPFRFFRVMMTDKNTNNDYFLPLQAIELFGLIYQ